jgi:hypothetical protein
LSLRFKYIINWKINKKIFLLVIKNYMWLFHIIILAVTFKSVEFLPEAKQIQISLNRRKESLYF